MIPAVLLVVGGADIAVSVVVLAGASDAPVPSSCLLGA